MSDGTPHYVNCFGSGPQHYVCALMEITDLRNRLQTETQLLLDGNKIASKCHREEVAALHHEMLVLNDERNAAEARSNLLACALRALLSKCPDCGGTGEVGTGIIQIGQPAQMPCFVCSGERGILVKECGK